MSTRKRKPADKEVEIPSADSERSIKRKQENQPSVMTLKEASTKAKAKAGRGERKKNPLVDGPSLSSVSSVTSASSASSMLAIRDPASDGVSTSSIPSGPCSEASVGNSMALLKARLKAIGEYKQYNEIVFGSPSFSSGTAVRSPSVDAPLMVFANDMEWESTGEAVFSKAVVVVMMFLHCENWSSSSKLDPRFPNARILAVFDCSANHLFYWVRSRHFPRLAELWMHSCQNEIPWYSTLGKSVTIVYESDKMPDGKEAPLSIHVHPSGYIRQAKALFLEENRRSKTRDADYEHRFREVHAPIGGYFLAAAASVLSCASSSSS
jgi:hypothetical protein